MKENGKIITDMDMVFKDGKTEQDLKVKELVIFKENGKTIYNMEKELKFGLMEADTKVNI